MTPTSPIVPGRELEVTQIAKNQNQYKTLPAFVDGNGVVLSRWSLTWKERLQILWQGFFYLQNFTFNQPLQPLRLSVEPPGFEES